MRTPGNRVSLVLIVLIGLSLVAFGQSGRMSAGVVSKEGFKLYWENRLEPPTPAMAKSFMSAALTADDSSNIITRIIWDGPRRIYLGYEVQVDVLPEAGTYRVNLRRVRMDARLIEYLGGSSQPGWQELPTPGWLETPPQTIRSISSPASIHGESVGDLYDGLRQDAVHALSVSHARVDRRPFRAPSSHTDPPLSQR